MKILKGFCIFWLVLFVLIIAYCAVRISIDPFINRKGVEKAEAYIVSTEKTGYSTSNISINYDIKLETNGKTVFRFKTAEGEEVTADFPYYFSYMPEDRTAYLLYMKDNPQEITLNSFFFYGFDVFMVGMMSFFPICLGTISTVVYLILKKEEKKKKALEKV